MAARVRCCIQLLWLVIATDSDHRFAGNEGKRGKNNGNEGNEGNEGDEGDEGNEGNEGAHLVVQCDAVAALLHCCQTCAAGAATQRRLQG